jgi:hypothetical protein
MRRLPFAHRESTIQCLVSAQSVASKVTAHHYGPSQGPDDRPARRPGKPQRFGTFSVSVYGIEDYPLGHPAAGHPAVTRCAKHRDSGPVTVGALSAAEPQSPHGASDRRVRAPPYGGIMASPRAAHVSGYHPQPGPLGRRQACRSSRRPGCGGSVVPPSPNRDGSSPSEGHGTPPPAA